MRNIPFLALAFAAVASTGCGESEPEAVGVHLLDTEAQDAEGRYISWREMLVDDQATSGGAPLRGADGLAVGDVNQDGFVDVISAHEDSSFVRIAYGSDNSDDWFRLSLAEGDEARAVEDVSIGDLNGDGWPDVIAACEQAHLLYLQNPKQTKPGFRWSRLIPEITQNRGAWIRASFGDLNGDGKPEVLAASRGKPDGVTDFDESQPQVISYFTVEGDPLKQDSWQEHVLVRVNQAINVQAIDMDGDGDLDVFGGSRGEIRVFWFENVGEDGEFAFEEHRIELTDEVDEPGHPESSGFQVDFHDFNGDGRTDVVLKVSRYDPDSRQTLGGEWLSWIEQPENSFDPWSIHRIGTIEPDEIAGFSLADLDGDDDLDLMAGSYSRGPRDKDGEDQTAADPLGRIAWYQNQGDGEWVRHDLVRRLRGMYDSWAALDLDGDEDLDFLGTRGNSGENDGVFWLKQLHSDEPVVRFQPARETDSATIGLPAE